jgi:hypothetical protein
MGRAPWGSGDKLYEFLLILRVTISEIAGKNKLLHAFSKPVRRNRYPTEKLEYFNSLVSIIS